MSKHRSQHRAAKPSKPTTPLEDQTGPAAVSSTAGKRRATAGPRRGRAVLLSVTSVSVLAVGGVGFAAYGAATSGDPVPRTSAVSGSPSDTPSSPTEPESSQSNPFDGMSSDDLEAPSVSGPSSSHASATRTTYPNDTLVLDDLPTQALAAYQRAEAAINEVSAACNLTWPTLAAAGQVLSNHGRTGDGGLSAKGVSKPAAFGTALGASSGAGKLPDTDAGALDDVAGWDRGVGPMMFAPSVWSTIGVDGDADGRRNPQDIDDAALSAAVYLCGTDGDDLSKDRALKQRLKKMNPHSGFVADVMASRSSLQADLDAMTTPLPTPDPLPSTVPTAPETTMPAAPETDGTSDDDRSTRGGTEQKTPPATPKPPKPTKTPTTKPKPTPTKPTPTTPKPTPVDPSTGVPSGPVDPSDYPSTDTN